MTKSILIADDQDTVRKTLGLILKDDYALDYARGGAEAVKKALEKDYDLLVLDLKMPDLNGVEVLKKIKEKKPACRACIITGYYEEYKDLIDEAKSLGADMLFKPLEMDEFRQKIKEFVA